MKKFLKKLSFISVLFLMAANKALAVTTSYNFSSEVGGFSSNLFSSPVLIIINVVGAVAMMFTIINLMVGFTRWKFLAGYNVDERNKAFHILKQALVGLMIMIIVLLIDIFIK